MMHQTIGALAQLGLCLLALGALLGWLVALPDVNREALGRLGIKHHRRILQLHLDYIMMGVILIAVSTALPHLPTWVQLALAIGAVLNPLLFLPLAFDATLKDAVWYRIVTVASFIAMSVGTVGAAVVGLTR